MAANVNPSDSLARLVADPVSDLFSPTKLDMWQRCQRAFYYRYILGLKSPPSAAMAFGRAMDDTTSGVYAEKMVTGETVDDVDDRWAHEWDRASSDVADWQGDDRGSLTDQGVKIVRLWRDRVAVPSIPTSVQDHRAVEVSGLESKPILPSEDRKADLVFHGVADVMLDIGGAKAIGELKTRARKMSEDEMVRSPQAAGYSITHQTNLMQWHVATRTKNPDVQVLDQITDPGQSGALLYRVGIAHRQVRFATRSGDFLPNRANMLCSKRWCAYASQCERECGGTVPE